jgi:hypothetical protein
MAGVYTAIGVKSTAKAELKAADYPLRIDSHPRSDRKRIDRNSEQKRKLGKHDHDETKNSRAQEHQESSCGCQEKTNHRSPAEIGAYRTWQAGRKSG